MKKIYCTLLILVSFLVSGSTMAQGFKIGVGGGLSFFSNSNSTESFNTGYHVGAKLKLDIPLVPITPVAFVNYHFISATVPFLELTLTILRNSSQLELALNIQYSPVL